MIDFKNSEKKLMFFLNYGYFSNKSLLRNIKLVNKNFDYDDYSLDELSNIARDLFLQSIEQEFKQNKINVIPLSGGLDSRIILSALLEFTDTSNIKCYSYGMPGSYDYEFSKNITNDLGIYHQRFDLMDYDYSEEDLMYHSEANDKKTFLFHNGPLKLINSLFSGCIHWSGILGDVVGGSAFPNKKSSDINSAIALYLSSKTYIKHKIDTNNFDDMIYRELDINHNLSLDEQLIFTERYENMYLPHICNSNHFYIKPFLNNNFMNFFLNAPDRFRENKLLYYSFIKKLPVNLFKYPTKNFQGCNIYSSIFEKYIYRSKSKLIRFYKPYLNQNFFCFKTKYNNSKSFRNLIIKCLDSLERRDILRFNCRKLLENLNHSNENYKLIILLVSLEINLRT